MPDISMCVNENCPLKLKCHRFTAIADMYQSYCGDFQPKDGKCEYFWDNTGYKKRQDCSKGFIDESTDKR